MPLGEEIHRPPNIFPPHRFFTNDRGDQVWDFLNQKNLWITRPTANEKIGGRSMTDDELYNFTKRCGGYLRESLANNLEYLNGLDAEQAQKQVRRYESEATDNAKRDIIAAGEAGPDTE
jgi:hypothetical protein